MLDNVFLLMTIVEYNSSIVNLINRWVSRAFSTELTEKLLESIIVLIIAFILVRFMKSLLSSLEQRNVISAILSEQIYRLLAISIYSIALIIITYIVTSVSVLLYFVLAVVIVILVANWHIIADVAAYYLLIAFRNVYQASLIELPRLGIRGRIVGSTLFHTRIRTPSGRLVYIPNHIMIAEPVIQAIAPQTVIPLEVSVNTPSGNKHSPIEVIESIVRQAIRDSKMSTRPQDAIIQIKSLEPSRTKIVVFIPVAGSEPRPSTINNIVSTLYQRLAELKPEIRVLYEAPPPA
ncbi:hypothetical protein PYJP_03700 [Pyrofollis japonicus]|nr:hypothetical protein PYJP_03700 [Pyrofollis japonicus]